ncbi:DUF2339 domain-containing protein [Shewanella cyperi]|uniref:DUF2339 domain-containing protein n=1 Tax=Shewanella cyperi TaxID=2814292 RepID=A0A974XKJ6_9GAMM|nr:DUF2339 domain-containing protein [Shewanella cyperi]QSX30014.1 DUF2339 domain-containing protein [Shewanella cyperi]
MKSTEGTSAAQLQQLLRELQLLKQQEQERHLQTELRLEALEDQLAQLLLRGEDSVPEAQAQAMGPATASPWHKAEPQEAAVSAQVTPAHPQTAKRAPGWSQKAGAALATGLAGLLGPLAGLLGQAQDFYRHYQSKGQGPVFLMTVAGIIAMTLGFGYLLQYSLDNWLSDAGKALLGFACANAILGLGVWLRRRQPAVADFGSALVGLGLVINYLCGYFVGPYYGLIPDSLSYLLLLAITLGGYWLALRLEARVISIVALLGGSLAPLMLLPGSQAPLMYLPYLLLLGLGSVALCQRLRWPLLLETTAVLHMACIEVLGFYLDLPLVAGTMGWLALLCLHGIFYLYGASTLWLFGRNGLSHRLLALPAALLAFMIYSLGSFSEFPGQWLAFNGLILSLAGWRLRGFRHLCWFGAAALAGFAALYLLSDEQLGLVLLFEALLLLYLGCRERQVSLRLESIALLLLGLGINCPPWLELLVGGAFSFDLPFIAWWLSTAALYLAARMLAGPATPGTLEARLLTLVRELANLCLVLALLGSAYLLVQEYSVLLVMPLGLALLYLAKRWQLRGSEMLAWVLQLLPALVVLQGIVVSGSVHFSAQPLYAQLARIFLFIGLLGAWYGYRRLYPKGRMKKLAWYARLLTLFLLPLLLLPKVVVSYVAWLAPALWAVAALALIIGRRFRHPLLMREAEVLLWLAILTTAVECLQQRWQGLLALTMGAVWLGALVLRFGRLPWLWQQSCRLGWQLAPFYGALVVAVIAHSIEGCYSHTIALSSLAVASYFYWLLQGAPAASLRPNYGLALGGFFAAALLPWLAWIQVDTRGADPWLLGLAQLTCLALMWQAQVRRLRALRRWHRQLPSRWRPMGWHGLLLLTYLPLSLTLGGALAAGLSALLMVCHGCWLMFLSLKPANQSLLRLAGGIFALACFKLLLLDMASASLLQKIVVFMLIGAILLAVAFFFQKARNRVLNLE